jgi:hypothetical protein
MAMYVVLWRSLEDYALSGEERIPGDCGGLGMFGGRIDGWRDKEWDGMG